MLINLWYVAEYSNNVTSKPMRVRLLGQNFVLFRDAQGAVHCLSDTCVHRGAALSGGWTKDSCIVCPYHGWSFDTAGAVKAIPPTHAKRRIPKKARVDVYPVQERYGWIWVFLGDDPPEERLPIPEFPEYDDKKYARFTLEHVFHTEASRAVENGMDMMHVGTVHPKFGDPDSEVTLSNLEIFEGSAKIDALSVTPPYKGHMRIARAETRSTESSHRFFLSGHCVRTHVKFKDGWEQILLDAKTPIDDKTTLNRTICARTFLKSKIFEGAFKKRLTETYDQDEAILRDVRPRHLARKTDREFSVKEDAFQILFRKMRQRRIDRGDQIDVAEVRRNKDKTVYVIPSPGRHPSAENSEAWVLDPVPLVSRPADTASTGADSQDSEALTSQHEEEAA